MTLGIRGGTAVATDERRRPALDIIRNRALVTLFFGHCTNDFVGGFIPVLYPLLSGKFHLSLSEVGLVSLAYTGMGAITQPFFGWLADRYGTRLIGTAIIWSAIAFGAIGFAPSFHLVLLLAALAGVGSGTFHPFGALNASAVIGQRQRNTAMSIYISGGTIGFALGPLIGVGLLALLGLHGTAIVLLPGAIVAAWLLIGMRSAAVHGSHSSRARAPATAGTERQPIPVRPLAIVILIMMALSWNSSAIVAFVPTWYKDLGYGSGFYGPLTTVLIIGGAFGALSAGALADRYGRRLLITGSLLLSIPLILLFAQFPGPVAFLSGFLVGVLGSASNPLLLVLAQQLMAGRAGVASGIFLGLGFVTGAIGVPITGAVADAFGIQNAMRLLALIALIAVPVALLVPSERRGHDPAEEAHRSAALTAEQASSVREEGP